jgi:hypothetical protein
MYLKPVRAAARSKAWDCGRSLVGIVGSNTAGGKDVCCVLSGSGLCDELITCPEESCRVRCVVVRDIESSKMRKPQPAWAAAPRGEGGGNVPQ